MEARGALCATLFVGFPHADIADAGCRRSSSPTATRRWRDAVATNCSTWPGPSARNLSTGRAARESLARRGASRRQAGKRPVVLLDHYDNCASGGTMDTMAVLGAILDAGLEDVAAFAIFDPAGGAADDRRRCRREVTLSLGGKLDMPSIGEGRAARGHRHGKDDLRRPLPQQGADGARRAEQHGADRGARYRQGRDRRDLQPCRAARSRDFLPPWASTRRRSAT